MNDLQKKSITRAKKTSFSLAEIATKAGINWAIQGKINPNDYISELFNVLFEHFRQYHNDKNEAKIKEFCKQLLGEGIKTDQDIKFLEKQLSLDDFYKLFQASVKDNEEKKIELYVNMLRALAFNKIHKKYKQHLFLIVKELTYEEINFLRQIYIYSYFPILSLEGQDETIENLFRNNSLLQEIMIQKYIRFGLLVKNIDDKFSPTELLKIFVEAIYKNEDLDPKALGKKYWNGINVFITAYQMSDHYLNTATEIQNLLIKHNF